ncbi:WD40 repeat-like protein [Fomitopsis betulina]|nr:WD40 repeat-like protein [Fomitopsis betulina]
MSLSRSIDVPSAVTALALVEDGDLLVGSDDGIVRIYSRSSTRVTRAVKSLGDEISSICCCKPRGRPGVWCCASGTRVWGFSQTSEKMILTAQDAFTSLTLGQEEEDVLNEIHLSFDAKYLAFSTDNGTVGVVELSTGRISRMMTKHASICGSVKFIPDRPTELVSGGYDSKLLHHDFQQRTLLSSFDLAQASPSSGSEQPGLQLSPPFVLSAAVSPTGILAVTTASGLLFVGTGGEKRPSNHAQKKRRKKWDGLNQSEGIVSKIAEGPVVAVAFLDQHRFVTCTLLGEVKQFTVIHDASATEKGPDFEVHEALVSRTQRLAKVNAISIAGDYMAIGGLAEDGKGVIEIWDVRKEAIECVIASKSTVIQDNTT